MEKGKEQEIARLFSEHYEKVHNLCSRMCLNRSTAQEITQEVFIKVFRSLEGFRGESGVSTWIYSIAVNQCLDHMRQEKRWYEKMPILKGLIRSAATPMEENVINRHLGGQILGRMSPTNRTLLILKSYLDCSYEQIAGIMNMTPASVGVQLTRARREALSIAKEEGIYDGMQRV